MIKSTGLVQAGRKRDEEERIEKRRKIAERVGIALIFILGLAFGRKVEDAMTSERGVYAPGKQNRVGLHP